MVDISKLKAEIGKKVFVVFLEYGSQRTSDYGKLEEVNDPDNIIIAKGHAGATIIPIDNGNDRILKVYDKQGFVVYDNESIKTKKK